MILNPPNVLQLVEDSPQQAAALVVRGKDIIVNTGYTCHNDMMAAAGIAENIYDLDNPNLEVATFRGGISKTGVSFDIWNQNDKIDVEAHVDALRAAYDFLLNHRKLSRTRSLEIAIYDDDYVLTHIFDGNGLTDVRRPTARLSGSMPR
jgi:hypothetical protein